MNAHGLTFDSSTPIDGGRAIRVLLCVTGGVAAYKAAEVLRDLRGAGYAFKDEWFLPHFEFRFPLHGSIRYGGIEVGLRHALEPWPVLGEEGAVGGTTRFVEVGAGRVLTGLVKRIPSAEGAELLSIDDLPTATVVAA